MVFLLKDISDSKVDAVILSKTSTKEDIENAIITAKQSDDWSWDDILRELPADCEIYDVWSGNLDEVFY